jgi:tRNA G18 (ribose-2'-O)-methylase SpoU
MHLEDPRLEPFRDLRADHLRRHDPWFIAEGALCIRRALEANLVVPTLLTTEAQWPGLAPLVGADTEVLQADAALMREITGFKFHRGCLAQVLRPASTRIDWAGLGAQSTVVFGEAVSNPSNVGALVRNCRSLGAHALVLDESSADFYSRRAVRTAMGALFTLPHVQVPDIAAAIAEYRQATGGTVWAAALTPDAQPLTALRRAVHTALVLGSEGQGLSAATLAACDAAVKIPMAVGADSLNVAAASAVFLYAIAPERA